MWSHWPTACRHCFPSQHLWVRERLWCSWLSPIRNLRGIRPSVGEFVGTCHSLKHKKSTSEYGQMILLARHKWKDKQSVKTKDKVAILACSPFEHEWSSTINVRNWKRKKEKVARRNYWRAREEREANEQMCAKSVVNDLLLLTYVLSIRLLQTGYINFKPSHSWSS
jgi:hypothetical protein